MRSTIAFNGRLWPYCNMVKACMERAGAEDLLVEGTPGETSMKITFSTTRGADLVLEQVLPFFPSFWQGHPMIESFHLDKLLDALLKREDIPEGGTEVFGVTAFVFGGWDESCDPPRKYGGMAYLNPDGDVAQIDWFNNEEDNDA